LQAEILNALGDDTVVGRAKEFGLEIEGLEKIAFARAEHMVAKMPGGDSMRRYFVPMFAAMFLDGFFAALSALDNKPEDCP
jgi:hypothetical protein